MSNTNNHPWSRDPVAQSAVRAAEDDAANWRRLEVGEVTQSGDEWCMGESAYGGLRWQCCTVGGTTILPHHSPCRRRRVPPPDHRDLPQAVAELRERVGRLEASVSEAAAVVGRKAQTLGSQLVERLQAFNAAIRSGESEMPKGPPPGLVTPPTTKAATVENATAENAAADINQLSRHLESEMRARVALVNRVSDLEDERESLLLRVAELEAHLPDAGKMVTPPQPAQVPPADGLRTERVTPPDWQELKWDEALAILHEGGDWGRGNDFHPGTIAALVIWADKEMDRLTAERDAAIRERDAAREECEDLRRKKDHNDRWLWEKVDGAEALALTAVEALRKVSSLDYSHAAVNGAAYEAHCIAKAALQAAPAAKAGGEAKQEPVAWGVLSSADPPHRVGLHWTQELADRWAAVKQREFTTTLVVVPLYAVPQPPRGWLTEGERTAIKDGAEALHQFGTYASQNRAELLRGLLDRTPDAGPRGWLTEEEREAVVHAIEGLREASGRRNNTDARTLVSLLARETPPRVKAPASAWEASSRDAEWIAAIREAGGEVE